MAFRIKSVLQDYEYRGTKSGTSEKTGKVWMSLILEDSNAYQLEVSVPAEYQADIYSMGLLKGSKVSVPVIAAAGYANNRNYSYVQLDGMPIMEDVAF